MNPTTHEPLKNLGRVFTLTDKSIEAVTWSDMPRDPFFGIVGAKRRVLSRRIRDRHNIPQDRGMVPI